MPTPDDLIGALGADVALPVTPETIYELRRRIVQLEAALRRARDDMEEWAAYASPYFREKWGLDDDLAAIDRVLK